MTLPFLQKLFGSKSKKPTYPQVQAVIDSPAVPEGKDGLEFDLGEYAVTIKKFYIDKDGDERGNCVYLDNFAQDQERMVFLQTEQGHLFEFYREHTADGFTPVEAKHRHIRELIDTMWPRIVATVDAYATYPGMASPRPPASIAMTQFGKYSIPTEIARLWDFESRVGVETYADGFALRDGTVAALGGWSTDPEFLASCIEFASANGSGSTYALWLVNDDLSNCPVLVFGDEGGIHVVASNLKDLLSLLTYDAEVSVNHSAATYERDGDDYEESENRTKYLVWARGQFVAPIETAEAAAGVVARARAKYEEQMIAFLTKYGLEV
jgi:hypothetical protein